MLKFDLEELEKYVSEGLLRRQRHSTLPLTIWKYSEKCKYEKAWNPTLRQMRGVVLDDEGNRVTRPFDKFFNFTRLENGKLYDELDQSVNLNDYHYIFVKYDGSLITVTENDKYGLIITSSGSFTSAHVGWAEEIIREKYPRRNFQPGFTYCFELIHPDNRIVVNYQEMRDLILLAQINIKSGWEVGPADRIFAGFPVAETLNSPLSVVIDKLGEAFANQEGVVMFFLGQPNRRPFRIKAKFFEYVRLHKKMDISNRDLWEALRGGRPIGETLDAVPDELMASVRIVEGQLKHEFDKIMWKVYSAFTQTQVEGLEDRKEFALYVMKNYKEISTVLFCLKDGQDMRARDFVWKMIKPERAQKLWGVQGE